MMTTTNNRIDVADLDCIHLTYDEPKKEEFWVEISNMIPWAKRVDGVKGSDAAHKAAGEASDTDWFVLIDGDNLPHESFFDNVFEVPDRPSAFRWKAVNHVNGLMYGNGGMSIWHKDFVRNMQTHEMSDGNPETAVEFCFDPDYHAMWNVYSTTYPNQSDFHAWRAGFREGVKMCLNRGARPTLEEFETMIHARNLDNLLVWMNVGMDVEYGDYAMAGARYGVAKLMFDQEWDYREVADFEWLQNEWFYKMFPAVKQEFFMDEVLHGNGNNISTRLGLPVLTMDNQQSAWVKQLLAKQHHQKLFMTKEIDVIRKREGW